mgnify:CR=1 FL=1
MIRILVATVATLVASPVFAQEEHVGAEPYRLVCQSCHGEEANGDVAPPLTGGQLDAEYVLAIVREGFGQMPPISTRELTDDQVRDIVGYITWLNERESSPASVAVEPSR